MGALAHIRNALIATAGPATASAAALSAVQHCAYVVSGCSSIGHGVLGPSCSYSSKAVAQAGSESRLQIGGKPSGTAPLSRAGSSPFAALRYSSLEGPPEGSSVGSSSAGGGGSSSSSSSVGPSGRRLEPSSDEIRAAYTHCAQLVRQHDPESLSWVMLLEPSLRARVLALRAFNLETLLVGESVRSKERALAAIRFQWWRDAVSRISGGAPPPAHPVLTALWDASRAARLGRYHMKRIVDAREEELMRGKAPLTMEELEGHCEGTSSQLLYLQLAAAGIASRDADHAASHLGKAVGITLALRGTPYQASQRRSLLPIELCAKHKVSQEEVFRGPPASEGLRDLALEMGAAAKAHLDESRALAPRLPKGAAPLLLPAVGAGEFLRTLERRGFDVFHPDLPGGGASPLRRAILIKWHHLMGTY